MPPRKIPRRRRRRPKSSWARKGASWGSSIGGSIGQLAGTVKNIVESLNVEKKMYDKSINTTVNNSGSIYSLAEIAQGLGQSDREGNKLKITSVSTRGTISISSAATYTTARIIIFVDTQQVADTAPSVTSVLESASPLAFYNKLTLGRFQILEDNMYSMHTYDNPSPKFQSHLKPMHHIYYNGANSTDIQKGGVYVLVISDQATNQPVFAMNHRTRYVDN